MKTDQPELCTWSLACGLRCIVISDNYYCDYRITTPSSGWLAKSIDSLAGSAVIVHDRGNCCFYCPSCLPSVSIKVDSGLMVGQEGSEREESRKAQLAPSSDCSGWSSRMGKIDGPLVKYRHYQGLQLMEAECQSRCSQAEYRGGQNSVQVQNHSLLRYQWTCIAWRDEFLAIGFHCRCLKSVGKVSNSCICSKQRNTIA